MRSIPAAVLLCSHLIGCGTVRIGAGLASTTTGETSVALHASIGLGGFDSGVVADTGVAVSRAHTMVTRTVEYDRMVGLWPAGPYGEDGVPRRMLRLGARVGQREPAGGDLAGATVLGAGAAYQFVTHTSIGSCVWFGMRDQTRHAVGIEAWLDAQLGGDASLGHGLATIGVVYQIDRYVRSADCGS